MVDLPWDIISSIPQNDEIWSMATARGNFLRLWLGLVILAWIGDCYTILLALFMVLMLLPVIYVTILLFTDRQLLWHQVTQCFRRLERLEKVAAETTWPQWSSLWPQTPRDKRKCASVAVAAGLSAVQRGTDLLLCLQKLYATITHSGAFLLLSLLLLGSLHECFMMHEQLEAMAMEVNSEEMATRMAQEQVDRRTSISVEARLQQLRDPFGGQDGQQSTAEQSSYSSTGSAAHSQKSGPTDALAEVGGRRLTPPPGGTGANGGSGVKVKRAADGSPLPWRSSAATGPPNPVPFRSLRTAAAERAARPAAAMGSGGGSRRLQTPAPLGEPAPAQHPHARDPPRGSSDGAAGDDLLTMQKAKILFCILARGSDSKDAWPKSPRGAAHFGNTRDDVARSLITALSPEENPSGDAAVVLIFENTRRTPSKNWWVLQPEFLEDLPVLTEYTVLRRCQELAEFAFAQDFKGQALGPPPPRPPGAFLLQQQGLEATALHFLHSLGPLGGALVLLDETFPCLPVADRARAGATGPDEEPHRVVFLLGLREPLSAQQIDAFTGAAAQAAWKIQRRSLGWVGEFTSKVIARLQVLHGFGQLLPALSWPQEEEQFTSALGWPCPRSRPGGLFARDGPLLHFVLPADMRLEDLTPDPCSPFAGACSRIARCCIAGLWRAHHAWDRCRLSFAFRDAVVTVNRRFKGRFRMKRQMEYHILRELQQLVEDALQSERRLGRHAVAVRAARRVQLIDDDGPNLLYRSDAVVELHLDHDPSALEEPPGCARELAEDLLEALWRPEFPEDDRPPSCMVLLCFLSTSNPWHHAPSSSTSSSRARLRCGPFSALTVLQSAILGEDGSGKELLSQLLLPVKESIKVEVKELKSKCSVLVKES
ncbi:unnamed protein product [Durusdinium trenchii]|uniref:Reticulon-like protein n=1 Tax=Durusdinium trenchii TaxID=1381693 RepID=A0ABP0QE09_9DINO